MDRDEFINEMRSRVAMCRKLARQTTDARTIENLKAMADEGEARIARPLPEKSG